MIKPISIEELQKANSPEDKIELTIKELQSLNENIYDIFLGLCWSKFIRKFEKSNYSC